VSRRICSRAAGPERFGTATVPIRYLEDRDQRILEHAGQVGYLQAQLAAAREQIRLLTGPVGESTAESTGVETPAPAAAARRPWWRRLFS
jgi:hypothetical protein